MLGALCLVSFYPEIPSTMQANRTFLAVAAVLGFLAVAIGAFGAHGLKPHLTQEAMGWFETGSRYHFYHSLAILAVALLAKGDSKLWSYTGWAFLLGILLFSGSLYVMAVTGIKVLGAVTPVGGLAFLAGWGMLAVAGWRR